jgi:ribose-phosphate pyrophosphokinase
MGTVLEHGASEVVAIVTHGISTGNAIEMLNKSKLSRVCQNMRILGSMNS